MPSGKSIRPPFAGRALALKARVDQRGVGGAIFRVRDAADAQRAHFVEGAACEHAESLVDEEEPAAGVADPEAERRSLQQEPEERGVQPLLL